VPTWAGSFETCSQRLPPGSRQVAQQPHGDSLRCSWVRTGAECLGRATQATSGPAAKRGSCSWRRRKLRRAALTPPAGNAAGRRSRASPRHPWQDANPSDVELGGNFEFGAVRASMNSRAGPLVTHQDCEDATAFGSIFNHRTRFIVRGVWIPCGFPELLGSSFSPRP